MEGNGRQWKAMEGNGRHWKVLIQTLWVMLTIVSILLISFESGRFFD